MVLSVNQTFKTVRLELRAQQVSCVELKQRMKGHAEVGFTNCRS